MLVTNHGAGRIWLVLLAIAAILVQTPAHAAPRWADTSERPGNNKGGKKQDNEAPVISGSPDTTAEVETFYDFQAIASDPEGNELRFSVANIPAWAVFDEARGYLSGFPAISDAGSLKENIVISVSDGKNTASLAPFSIAVGDAPPNTPPVISGSPPDEALVAQIYSFVPTASDADDDVLSFSIENKPDWANFDTTSGTLSGAPTDADVRIYDNIYISVSDGTANASTSSFSIAVVDTTIGTATISWLAPDQNVDGTALIDLSGYRIYYGNLSGQYSRQLEISDASIMTAVIDDLSQGAWYFAATALTSQGLESALSNELVMLVP
jgi:hypothetical protein